MPLPEATLSLGPLISPGGTEPVKPKVAMLVRLSSATIDALTSVMNEKEKVSVDLGTTPGIHIDGTFYPMRMQKEETPHEIYLRVPRSNNSLKLYANVAEKLFIEHNEIGDDLKVKIREKTREAAKQRNVRKTQFMEAPPIQPAKITKKKREPARSAIRSSDQTKLNVSTSSARVPSPAPPPPTKPFSASAPSMPGLLDRLIRCMAFGKRNRDTIVKLVSGDDPSIRRYIIELMEEVGEPTSPLKKGEDVGSKIWCLKAQSWLHVRPLEWPGLNTQERLQLSRTGRMKLASLGYSEKDPEWSPFAYRSTDTNVAAEKTTITMSQGDPRQREKPDSGTSSSEIKKSKTKSGPNAEIHMEDESSKATRSSTTKTRQFVPSVLAAKKVPGSGFKVGKSSAQDSSSAAEASRHVSEKGIKSARPSLPLNTTTASQSSQKEKMNSSATTVQRPKKMRGLDAGFGSESERDRESRPKPAIRQEERRDAEVPIVKRRQGPRDSYDSDASTSLSAPQKKRRLDRPVAASPSSKDVRSTDFSLPKKPDIAPSRQNARKERTPPPSIVPLPKINKKANGSSCLTTTGNGNMSKTPLLESTSSAHSVEARGRSEGKTSGKRRRGSPIYTSSEDEGQSKKTRRITKASSPVVETNNHKAIYSRRHEREPRPLPTDHAGLRMRYTATYGQCMAALTTLLSQKSRIDSMLRHADAGSVTDSDCDGELMDVEDLKKLSGDYERMHEELETIRQKFADPVQ